MRQSLSVALNTNQASLEGFESVFGFKKHSGQKHAGAYGLEASATGEFNVKI